MTSATFSKNSLSNLTPDQIQVWMAQQVDPKNGLYFPAELIIVDAPLAKAQFQEAFDALVASNDALRTYIVVENGMPQQKVYDTLTYAVPAFDFSTQTMSDEELYAWALTRSTEHSLIDAPYIFDIGFIKLTEQRYAWFMQVNHVLLDGQSFALIRHMLGSLYYRLDKGTFLPTQDQPQFADHVADMHAFYGSAAQQADEQYWENKLKRPFEQPNFYGINPATNRSPHTFRHHIQLGTDRSVALRQLANHPDIHRKNEDVTLFAIFTAIQAALLNRISDITYFSIGGLYHGRPRGHRATLGMFSRILPLTVNLTPDISFKDLINQMGDESSQTLLHNSMPIVASGSKAYYDASLNYRATRKESFGGLPTIVHLLDPEQDVASFNLSVNSLNGANNFLLDFDLQAAVFSPTQAEYLAQHFIKLIDGVIADLNQPIAAPSLLNPQDILKVTLAGDFITLSNHTIIDSFNAHLATNPTHIAVQHNAQTLTYAELDEEATELAHLLIEQGVTKDSFVGIHCSRSIDMIVAIWGVLKAGGAYLPLDPSYPQERLAYMLYDAQPTVVLSRSDMHPLPDSNATILLLDSLYAAEKQTPLPIADPTDLAYLIYTSGSTGNPKGVMIEHKSLLNYVTYLAQTCHLTPHDNVLQFASLNFDTAVEEIFMAFVSGATLILRSDDMLGSIGIFLEQCDTHGITLLDLPTAYWHELARGMVANNLSLPASIHTVIIGGEKASRERLSDWFNQVDNDSVCLLNTYGPTEATIAATLCRLLPEHVQLDGELPIGQPVANVQALVLDKRLQPVPVGVAGELCIGGKGVARGYLNRKDLTAEKFVTAASLPVYKTGDLVRLDETGTLTYIGRKDHQVKIRGYRIELGEVETALSELPSVQEAIVLAFDDPKSKQQHLVAYVVSQANKSSETVALRTQLATKLPNYALPTAFIPLTHFPMMPNGKLDRRSLPKPSLSTARVQSDNYVAPNTANEKLLVDMWQSLLNIERVGIHDNYFDLGGNSLLAIRMMTELQSFFDKTFSFNLLLDSQTIAELAPKLEDGATDKTTAARSLVMPLKSGKALPPLFLIHANSGVMFYQIMTKYLAPNQPVLGIQAAGLDGKEATIYHIKDKATRYIQEMKRAQPTGPYFIGGFSLGGIIAFEIAQQLRSMDEEVGLLAMIEGKATYSSRINKRPLKDMAAHKVQSHIRNIQGAGVIGYVDYLKRRGQRKLEKYRGEKSIEAAQKNDDPLSEIARHTKVTIESEISATDYQIKPYAGDMALFMSEVQPYDHNHDTLLGWRDYVTGAITVTVVPGNHGTMLNNEDHAKHLAQALQKRLNETYIQSIQKFSKTDFISS